MRLEMCRIDHQPVCAVAAGRQRDEDPVEHAKPAPTDEAIIDRLGWPVRRRRVAPPQAIADDK